MSLKERRQKNTMGSYFIQDLFKNLNRIAIRRICKVTKDDFSSKFHEDIAEFSFEFVFVLPKLMFVVLQHVCACAYRCFYCISSLSLLF